MWRVGSVCLQTLEGHSSIVLSLSFSPDGTKIASFSESKAVGCDERGIYHAPFTLNVKGESSEMEIKSKKDANVSIMQMRLARGMKGFVSSARKRQDQKMKFSRGKYWPSLVWVTMERPNSRVIRLSVEMMTWIYNGHVKKKANLNVSAQRICPLLASERRERTSMTLTFWSKASRCGIYIAYSRARKTWRKK